MTFTTITSQDDCKNFLILLSDAVNDVEFRRIPEALVERIGNRMVPQKDPDTCWKKFLKLLKIYLIDSSTMTTMERGMDVVPNRFDLTELLRLAYEKIFFGTVLSNVELFLRDSDCILRRIDRFIQLKNYAFQFFDTWSNEKRHHEALTEEDYQTMIAISNETYKHGEKESCPIDEKTVSCAICLNILYVPVSVGPCNHKYCSMCIQRWCYEDTKRQRHDANNNPSNRSCPNCRAQIETITSDVFVKEILDSFLKTYPEKKRTEETRCSADRIELKYLQKNLKNVNCQREIRWMEERIAQILSDLRKSHTQ